MRAMRICAIRCLLLLALVFTPAAWADYYVVVSDQNPTRQLSQTEALHMFMGRTRSFPHGDRATAYDLADDAERADFYHSLGGMSLAQVTSYWARLMFSGRSLPPQRLEDRAAMMERVRSDPTAIGWLPQAPTERGLRAVLILKAAP